MTTRTFSEWDLLVRHKARLVGVAGDASHPRAPWLPLAEDASGKRELCRRIVKLIGPNTPGPISDVEFELERYMNDLREELSKGARS